MTRRDLQRLALMRLRDAEVLYAKRRYAGAYYLAGYAVECALKACIARQVRQGEFPDLERVRKSYTHDLNQLVGQARLRTALDTQILANPAFDRNWAATLHWNESARYEFRTQAEARDILKAVSDPQSGVLAWLKTYW